MAFEGSGVPEVRSAVIYPLYKGKGERTKSRNYICISLLSINEKKYTGVLVDRVHRVRVQLMMSKGVSEEGRDVQNKSSP